MTTIEIIGKINDESTDTCFSDCLAIEMHGKQDPAKLKFGIYQSGAGWYLGWYCPCCGPFSRESHYFATKEEAGDYLQDLYK